MTEFKSVSGTLIKEPKVVKLDPLMLILSISSDSDGTVTHCLAVKHALNLMYSADIGRHIAVYGHFNKRKMLVVNKFMIQSNSQSVAI